MPRQRATPRTSQRRAGQIPDSSPPNEDLEARGRTIPPVKPGAAVDQREINRRKVFLEFGEAEAARLRKLGARLRGAFPRLIDGFYDHLRAFEATRPYLTDNATVARLKRLHAEYFDRLTSGTYDQAYVTNRLQVGTAHHQIGLEPQWYLGAYSRYLTGLLPTIMETDQESRLTIETLSALIKVVFFDIGLALDTYIEADRRAIAVLTDHAHASEQRFRHMAYYDPVTNLPNRVLFVDRLSQILARARWNGGPVAILFIDLDRFKLINDGLGHDTGDWLLRAVAERLTASVRDGDTVARFGGDEFTILLAELRKIEDLPLITDKLFAALKPPFVINDRELFVTASIGISSFPTDGSDAATLLKNADAAMYQAKEQGRNVCRLYSPELNAKTGERLAIEARLRHAIEHAGLRLHYQPIVDASTGAVTGAEALVRLTDADGQAIPPDQFIPVAEETGLIIAMGEWVLLTACAQAQAWRADGFPRFRVAVNLSARQFRLGGVVATVRDALLKTGLDPGGLTLELTESLLIQDMDAAILTLRRLAELRVLLSIDDFGTGYSSLGYLERLPLHTIKIDRSFVRNLATGANATAIAPAIIAMAHALGMKTVAEGVETEAQFAFLRAHGCDAIQGYLFSQPLPPEEFTDLLRSNRRLTM